MENTRNKKIKSLSLEEEILKKREKIFNPTAMLSMLEDLKEEQEKLKISERRVVDIIQGTPIPILVVDKNHKVIFWNKSLEILTGVNSKNRVGTNKQWSPFYSKPRPIMADFIIDGKKSEIQKLYSDKAFKPGLIKDSFEATDFFSKLGKTGLWLHFTASPIKNTEGEIIGSIETIEDITEKKKAEDKLGISELRYRRLFETAKDAILILDSKTGEIVDSNTFIQEFLDYSKKELAGKNLWDISPAEYTVESKKRLNKLKKNKYIRYEDIPLRTRGGEIRYVEFVANTYDVGDEIVIQCNIRDITERREAEDELIKNKDMLEESQRMGLIGTWSMDILNDILEWTEQNYEIFGIEKGTSMNFGKFFKIVHPEDRKYVSKKWRDAIKGEVYDIEHRIIVGGNIKWVREKANIIFDEKGHAIFGIGITQDITEKKNSEELLKQSEEILHKTSKLAKIGGWELDFLNKKLYWTDEVRNIHEVPAEYIPDLKSAINFYHPEYKPIIAKAVKDAIEKKKSFDLNLKLITAKGNHIWVRSQGNPECEGGKCVKVSGTFQDITEKKIAEDELAASNELLRQTGSIALIGGWEVDAKTMSGSWTEEVAEIYDLPKGTKGNTKLGISLYDKESRPIIEKAVLDAIKKGISYDLELGIKTAKGNHKWIRTMGEPVYEGNKIIKIRGAFQDITKLKESQYELVKLNQELEARVEERTSELQKANDELQEIDTLKTDFMNMISHELKTPLTAMSAHLEILLEKDFESMKKDNGENPVTLSLAAIKRNNYQMKVLITNLLEVSRIQSKTFVLNIEKVDAVKVAEEVVEDLKILAEQTKIEVKVVPCKLPKISIDRERLTEIFNNLIINAIKFTDKGHIKITCRKKNGFVYFNIIDTGIGIKKKKLSRLFEKFYQVGGSLSSKFAGSGLGLPITKQLLELQGGDISVKSVYGKGSTFTIKLPIKYKKSEEYISLGKEVGRVGVIGTTKEEESSKLGAEKTPLQKEDELVENLFKNINVNNGLKKIKGGDK